MRTNLSVEDLGFLDEPRVAVLATPDHIRIWDFADEFDAG